MYSSGLAKTPFQPAIGDLHPSAAGQHSDRGLCHYSLFAILGCGLKRKQMLPISHVGHVIPEMQAREESACLLAQLNAAQGAMVARSSYQLDIKEIIQVDSFRLFSRV